MADLYEPCGRLSFAMSEGASCLTGSVFVLRTFCVPGELPGLPRVLNMVFSSTLPNSDTLLVLSRGCCLPVPEAGTLAPAAGPPVINSTKFNNLTSFHKFIFWVLNLLLLYLPDLINSEICRYPHRLTCCPPVQLVQFFGDSLQTGTWTLLSQMHLLFIARAYRHPVLNCPSAQRWLLKLRPSRHRLGELFHVFIDLVFLNNLFI